jgi:transposase-like protein
VLPIRFPDANNRIPHEMTLGKWVKQTRKAAESQTATDTPLGETERLELIRLRVEAADDKSAIAELQTQIEFAKYLDVRVMPMSR